MPMERKENLVKDKWALLLLFLVFCPLLTCAQRDLIILRDGSERRVKIVMVKNDNTLFATDKKSLVQESIPNKDIYMIKYDKRGNVFFTENGERISGADDAKIPSNATAIYLLRGEEIIGYNVEMDANKRVIKRFCNNQENEGRGFGREKETGRRSPFGRVEKQVS